MSPGPPDPNPPAGHTLAAAMSVLGVFALGLAAAAGFAIVRRMDLPTEIPAPVVVQSPTAPEATPPPAPDAAPDAAAQRAPIFIPTPVHVPALADNPDRPGTIYDPAVLELVEIGITMRRDGDTAGALQKLLSADKIHPGHPRILWELASVYKAMALRENAEETMVALVALGPDFGGEYYELASHSLRGTSDAQPVVGPAARLRPTFSFGDTLVTPAPSAGDGERVTVRLAIQSALGQPIPPTDIGLVMQFYDLVDGEHIDPTRSNPPTQAWPTYPVNWDDAGIEIVEWGYHMPQLTPEEVAAVGKRQYYGYVARLYYRDTLQDVIAEPRTLHAVSTAPTAAAGNDPAPMLDDSLFPN